MSAFPPQAAAIADLDPARFITDRHWQPDEALVIVTRNHEIDRDALAAAVMVGEIAYIGMIGSVRKVQRVFDQLRESGVTQDRLNRVYAPIGLNIDADAPAEIAVSVIAEILAVLRNCDASHLRMRVASK